MKHITDENIIALLDAKKIDEKLKQHLSDCDTCFKNYSFLKANYLDNINNGISENVPEKFLIDYGTKHNLDLVKKKTTIAGDGDTSGHSHHLSYRSEPAFKEATEYASKGSFDTAVLSSKTSFLLNSQAFAFITGCFIFLLTITNNIFKSPDTYNFTAEITRSYFQIVIDDLSNYNEQEIKDYAEENGINLQIEKMSLINNNEFKQYPKHGETINPSDTLKIILPWKWKGIFGTK